MFTFEIKSGYTFEGFRDIDMLTTKGNSFLIVHVSSDTLNKQTERNELNTTAVVGL